MLSLYEKGKESIHLIAQKDQETDSQHNELFLLKKKKM